MSWWNLAGMNPKFKDFTEKYPDATMLGMIWALYWRLAIFIFTVEIIVVIVFATMGTLLSMLR